MATDTRRSGKFREILSAFMVIIAAAGGAYILIDPQFSFTFAEGTTLKIGGMGFSADLKGAVVSLIIVGGFVAVKEYWLGASASGQNQAEAMSRIAEAKPVPVAPAVVAPVNNAAAVAAVDEGKPV